MGISSCLLGEEVRWDGGHKLDQLLIDQLGSLFRYCPVCPEVESGFNTPREPFRLVGDPSAPRLVTSRTKQDHTKRMLQWVRRRVRGLEGADLGGFIFKGKSPSCGMERVRVYGARKGGAMATSQGLFAGVFVEHFPLVPVEDAGRLHDPALREGFIERIFVMKRWRDALRQHKRSRGALVRFHTEHKLLILSHSPQHYRVMGNLVARAGAMPITVLYDEYQRLLMEALLRKATTAKHVNCLQHIMGYFKKQLSSEEREGLWKAVDHYRQGTVPLNVPIALVNHYVRFYDQSYLKGQHYLHPHPLKPPVYGSV